MNVSEILLSTYFKVGVLDIDICGPSQARMFGCENESVHSSEEGFFCFFGFSLILIMFRMGTRFRERQSFCDEYFFFG